MVKKSFTFWDLYTGTNTNIFRQFLTKFTRKMTEDSQKSIRTLKTTFKVVVSYNVTKKYLRSTTINI